MNPALLQKGSNSFRTDSEIKDHEGYNLKKSISYDIRAFKSLKKHFAHNLRISEIVVCKNNIFLDCSPIDLISLQTLAFKSLKEYVWHSIHDMRKLVFAVIFF